MMTIQLLQQKKRLHKLNKIMIKKNIKKNQQYDIIIHFVIRSKI